MSLSFMMSTNTFLYFAYGSNLLAKRIHINNPTAVRVGIAKLKNYRLDFNYKSIRWQGAAATIVPDKGKHLWGALWEIDNVNMESLDRQEGVGVGVYEVKHLPVELPDGQVTECRTYQLCVLPETLKDGEILPESRRPSKIYMDTIIEGAIETGLPEEYIKQLRSIPHNGYCGDVLHHCD